jgi:SAM-dependent methyltransferase
MLLTEGEIWAPRDYVELPPIPDHWRVVDVGPGPYPLRRANLFVDRDPEILKPLSEAGGATLVSDINDGFPGIPDKSFDYAWCSHLLEHCDDPSACAASLSRIAKSGTIVVPSAIKDGIFNFEEPTHLWHVLANPTTGKPPIFIRLNPDFIDPLHDLSVKFATCSLYRTGANHECHYAHDLSTWFKAKEQFLDITFHWVGILELIVIG